MTTIADVRADLIAVLGNIDGWTTQNPYVGDMAPHPYSTPAWCSRRRKQRTSSQ
jgi:hypothetical protein